MSQRSRLAERRHFTAWSIIALGLIVARLTLSAQTSVLTDVQHVVIIGCDGFGSLAITESNTPALHRLMKEGAYTLHARGVMPTSSSPNWASMIMGAGPEQHGVTSNDWETNKFEITPTVRGPARFLPNDLWAAAAPETRLQYCLHT